MALTLIKHVSLSAQTETLNIYSNRLFQYDGTYKTVEVAGIQSRLPSWPSKIPASESFLDILNLMEACLYVLTPELQFYYSFYLTIKKLSFV